MPLPQLTNEQIRTWTIEQKDRWWLENVYRGDMPQLTLRSAATGFILGGILCATNLYVGAKTGWALGVGITSVILAFSFHRLFARGNGAREFTILENNCSQSIATAAGYMTTPMTSSMVAYMLIDGKLLPWYQLVIWNVLVSILGVLFAFPLKRRFINDEQYPFPEGRAAAVVMDSLHHADASGGMEQARVMLWAGGLAGLIKFLQAESIQSSLQGFFRRGSEAAGSAVQHAVIRFPERLDFFLDWLKIQRPKLRGIDMDQLTIIPSLDLSLIGAGGLMGIRAGCSLMIGALLNYFILAPWMIQIGDIHGRIVPETGQALYGLRAITMWSLWPGVACMVVASFVSLCSRPGALWTSIAGLFRKQKSSEVLRDIELPLWISFVGIPFVSLIAAYLAHQFFGVNMVHCLIGLPLTFILTVVAANSTALTSITPIGATSKITQLFYGLVSPGNIRTNLATASLTAEVVSNASNLLMDIKPGYMLGAKPRQQAIGHLIGILAGSICSVPLFFLLFASDVHVDARGVTTGIETLQSEKFPMPSATVWKAVAEALTQGLSQLPRSVHYAIGAGALVGGALEVSRIVTRGKFPLSAVGLGLAFVVDFGSSFAMFLGAVIFWSLGVERPTPEGKEASFWQKNREAICAGVIAGASLMGILDALVAVLSGPH